MGFFDRWRKGRIAGGPAPAPQTPPEPPELPPLSAPEVSAPELREAYPFLTVPCLALPRDLSPEALLRCWRKAGAEGAAPVLLRMDDMLCELLEDARWQGGDAGLDAYLTPAIDELWRDEEAGIHLGTPADRAQPQHRLLSFDRFGSDPGDPVLLAFVLAEEPWQVFRYLPIGGWNSCPPPELIAAFCRDLWQRYGAVPAAIGGDTLELVPARRPREDECFPLGLRMYAFCPVIVTQGVGSIWALADSLRASDIWYFWWD